MSEAEKANETKAPAAAAAAASSSAASTASSPEDLLKQQNELLKLFGHSAISNKPQEPAPHKFWNTQPVPDKRDAEQQHGALEEKTVADVRQKPYDLPKGFEWVDLDVSKQEDIDDVYMLLYENYVEDDDNMFRFDYSREFLRWAMTPPGFHRDWHVGVRVASGKRKLVGMITGVPVEVNVYKKEKIKMAEINFLCVHKKLRSKRLAPVLIKEVTRRVNIRDQWQAVYTAGIVLPQPVSSNRYWHRSLNPKKLIEVAFSRLQRNMTMAGTIKMYKLDKETNIAGLRPLEEKDSVEGAALLNAYLSKFNIAQHYTADEYWHWFGCRPGVITTHVVECAETKKITDMTSFYTLPSSVIGHPKHKTLNAAYSYYHVPGKHTLKELIGDAMILARQSDHDVFNALDLMENTSFLRELLFGPGDGNLQYYLYNWSCPEMPPADVGLVLL